MSGRVLFVLAAMAAVAAVSQAATAAPRAIRMGFGSPGWTVRADSPWWANVDIRDVLTAFHPFVVSRTGAVAGATREVTIPSDWQPPFALRFYCADNYYADVVKHRQGMVGLDSFFGHRIKQALIDDRVVWERDVVDDAAPGSQTVFTADITPYVKPGMPFRLTLRVVDRTSTTVRDQRDVRFRLGDPYHPGDSSSEQPPRFHTIAMFADAVVGEAQAVAAEPAGSRPHEAAVAKRHAERGEVRPRGSASGETASLKLVAPCRIPAPGYPITCGVPFAPGVLPGSSGVRVDDGAGRPVPVQTRVTGRWPDGSVRWLLLHAIAPGGAEPGRVFRLTPRQASTAQPDQPVRVTRRAGRITMDTGAVRVELGSDPTVLVDSVTLSGQTTPALRRLVLRMALAERGGRQDVEARVEHIDVSERGPVAARVDCTGTLTASGQHIGRFTFRVYAYAGLPTLQTHFRVVNDLKQEGYKGSHEDPALPVCDLSLVAEAAGVGARPVAFGREDGDPVTVPGGGGSLQQVSADRFDVAGASGRRAAGWISGKGDGGAVHAKVWRFWEQYPKALTASGDRLTIALFAPTADFPLYKPRFGEAKRHDVWFTFGDTPANDAQALGLLGDAPPRLQDREWTCLSGAIQVMDPAYATQYPRFWRIAAFQDQGVTSDIVLGHFGIRDFGDNPYRRDVAQMWRNGYWAMVLGSMNYAMAGGDERWMQRCFEIARHIADVDSVDIPRDHADWNEWDGLTVAIGIDHSVHGGQSKWPAFQAGEQLFLHYWLTGDPDSYRTGVANADYLVRSAAGLGSAGVREQTRPVLSLLLAWQATGDRRYLTAARRYLNLKYQRKHVIEWRRGAYITPVYDNWQVVSSGLDSMYAMSAYQYYRLTGDVDAAQLVAAVADSIYAEAMLPQEDCIGSFVYYVRYSRAANYYPEMATLFHMTYDVTGDLRFLRAGRAAFARYLLGQSPESWGNFGWLDPEHAGWIREQRDIPTAPLNIELETPDPDPSNFRPKD